MHRHIGPVNSPVQRICAALRQRVILRREAAQAPSREGSLSQRSFEARAFARAPQDDGDAPLPSPCPARGEGGERGEVRNRLSGEGSGSAQPATTGTSSTVRRWRCTAFDATTVRASAYAS